MAETATEDGTTRKRRRGWDQQTPVRVEPEQTGPLIAPATLPTLTAEQVQALQRAKKYCQDISTKHENQIKYGMIIAPYSGNKNTENQVIQMQTLQDAANKQRALLLMCRIYVGSINFELGEETVKQAFCHFGTIKSVNLSWDAASMKHKGYAFVEYENAEAAQMALEQMNGVLIGGRNIKVGRPNNVPQAAPIIAKIQQEAAKYPRIYVASIHIDLTTSDVRSVFEAFGTIKNVELAPDNSPGKHRGWGFIDYEDHKSAVDAIAAMNLFDLGGQFLRVGRALTPPLPIYPPNAGPVLPGLITSAALGAASSSLPGLISIAPQVPTSIPEATAPAVVPKTESLQAKLNQANEERSSSQDVSSLQQEENVSISGSNARLMIMKKLSRKSESNVIVLRNMVTVEDLDEQLEEEVTSECSKYGTVVKVVIYQERQGVEDDAEVVIKIFVIFTAPSEAEAAVKALDGRWFGGQMIKADLYDQDKFETSDLSH